LFIDVLLLKPQAYKHLVFNVLGRENTQRLSVQRIRLLSILFEIYLSWAYQEKKFHAVSLDPRSIYHSILSRGVLSQYIYFGIKCCCDDLITHWLLKRLIYSVFQWRSAVSPNVISLTVVISSGTKLFPILMLIWPYDDIAITQVITWISNLTLVEALRLITGFALWKPLVMFIVVSLVKTVATRTLLIVLLSHGNVELFHRFVQVELRQLFKPLKF
jgi:hypothetical protein